MWFEQPIQIWMNTDLLLRRLLGTRGVATQWHSTKPLTGIKQETCNCKFPLLGKRIHAVEMFIYSEKLILYATIGSTEMDCKCIEIRLSSSIKTLSTLANPTINCTNSNFNAIAWNLTFLLLFSSFSLPFLFPFFFLFFFSFLFLSSLIMIPQVPPKSRGWFVCSGFWCWWMC